MQTALGSNEPIVALESTVITHGMPDPSNLEYHTVFLASFSLLTIKIRTMYSGCVSV